MKRFLGTLLLFLPFVFAQAQFVTIPDPNFVTYLQTQFPSCMSGNQLDTTCATTPFAQTMNMANKGIANFSGLEYFTQAMFIDVSNNPINSLPILTAPVSILRFGNCQFTSVPAIPSTVQLVVMSNNQISNLNGLPANLRSLYAGQNPLTTIAPLPAALENLDLQNTGQSVLPLLPSTLKSLICANNPLGSLPSLPPNLESLVCNNNGLTTLPPLPNTLRELLCDGNNLGTLPVALPPNMTKLTASNTGISAVPPLPASIIQLNLNNNPITALPPLPTALNLCEIENTQITSLPTIPNGATILYFDNNQLTSIPPIPPSVQVMRVNNNQIACLPPFPTPTTLLNFYANNNPLTCVPNYPTYMQPLIGTLPLCVPGDPINNPSGCVGAEGLGGQIFKDNNANCQLDGSDLGLPQIPMRLYDNLGSLQATSQSYDQGFYFFDAPTGTWTVEMDTIGKPFRFLCPQPGLDSTVTLTTPNPLAQGIHFEAACKPGFDVGAKSISTMGWLFPGQPFQLKAVAGDLSKIYGLQCAAGIAGQVEITVNGPVNFTGVPSFALTPTVAGNTYTYTIPDMGAVNPNSDFVLDFTTQTTATAGNTICITVSVSPTAADYAPLNNTLSQCFSVVNSYDPNMKEVYPTTVLPGYDGWLTYTIHFQNTGNAPAFNIRLEDTLSTDFDFASFDYLSASHAQTHVLRGNHLTIHFPNILLPDSLSDPQGSQGYFQFRIKPRAGMTEGSNIQNRAAIYFDYNAPVITNYAETAFETPTAISDVQVLGVNIFPNPGQGTYQVELPNGSNKIEYHITDLFGRIILKGMEHHSFELDLTQQPQGIYLLHLSNGTAMQTIRIVQQ